MKCYIVSHGGMYLGGYSLAWAYDEEGAKQTTLALLKARKFPEKDCVIYSITESRPGESVVIWDGDY